MKQILTFSRHAEQDIKPVMVHLIVKEVLKLLRSTIPSSIEFRQEVDASEITVLADPTSIHQVVMTLCTNAYLAMRGTSGVLGISLKPVTVGGADPVSTEE